LKNKSSVFYYHAMLIPGVVLLLIFSIMPMFGLIMAFQTFNPILGFFQSPFVGLDNFKAVFTNSEITQAMYNTLVIAIIKIILQMLVPITFAILLNECRLLWFKRGVQTIVYMPFFLSWVIVAEMFSHMFALNGMVNTMLMALGFKNPIMFMASNLWFQPIVIGVDVWKNFGFNAVIYIAAITGIDPNLYEAADIDGATRWQKVKFVTLPGIISTVVLLGVLSIGGILNAGFDEIFNMYNPLVYKSGDILDTLVYRIGIGQLQYSVGTAVGLFKSVVSFVLITVSFKLAHKFAGYRIF